MGGYDMTLGAVSHVFSGFYCLCHVIDLGVEWVQ
jgi:hypothetical protein